MKKILYIFPILVFAMVVLSQDAKAQNNGQTGNASNGGTIFTTNSVITSSLVAAGNNNGSGTRNGSTQSGGTTGKADAKYPQTASVVFSLKLNRDATLSQAEIDNAVNVIRQSIADAAGVSVKRVSISKILEDINNNQ